MKEKQKKMYCSLNPKEFSLQLYIFNKTKQNIFTYLRSQTKLVVFLLMNEYETAVYHHRRQTFYNKGQTKALSISFWQYSVTNRAFLSRPMFSYPSQGLSRVIFSSPC